MVLMNLAGTEACRNFTNAFSSYSTAYYGQPYSTRTRPDYCTVLYHSLK
jgi:hypothetical protein